MPQNQPTRQSRSAHPQSQGPSRKDHAAHVSLPSDAIVKQRGIAHDPGNLTREELALSPKGSSPNLADSGPKNDQNLSDPPLSRWEVQSFRFPITNLPQDAAPSSVGPI